VTLEALQQELNIASNLAASLGQKHSGLMNIYNSACIVGNRRDMDNVRAQIHECLDQLLDTNARIFMLTRKMTGLD
jgi:hypothetical protein